jgi:DNA polymerase-3 subunit epsilon
VLGRSFDEQLITLELDDCDALISYGAKFDRSFWIKRFPDLHHPWICALRDYEWPGMGRFGHSQAARLAELGHFYEAHRAGPDAWALAVLLSMYAPDGRTFAANLLEAGRRTEYRIRAEGAPYGCREALKVSGYRWDSRAKVWWRDVAPAALEEELERLSGLNPFIRPRTEEVDWFTRHVT